MKIAYCRDCKSVIAAGSLSAEQRTVVVHGKRKIVSAIPSHAVDGAQHTDVGLLDVPDQLPVVSKPGDIEKFFKDLAKKHKAEFK